ncbi:RRQRL motif-containing zinc-binding protein [Streptomyces goshikiensis]|uniref:RRQRL motif-containing zinc-binding protein n=1 Tax=Streptomyces goshikiensis TaxID=1942 RepID=UPI0036FC0CFA
MPRPQKKRRREMNRVPRSDALMPEYDRGAVPEGLVTRRQSRDMGLSPGGNEGAVAILRCQLCATRPQWSCTHPTRGYLLPVDLAKPKRVPTLAQERALDQAMAARQTAASAAAGFTSASPRSSAAAWKSASDEHPVTFTDPVTKEESTHGTASGRAVCLHHVLSVWLAADRAIGQPVLSLIRNSSTGRISARQLS